MPYPATPRFPDMLKGASSELEVSIKTVVQYMWNDLIKPFNQAGLIPVAICLPIAQQPPAENFPEGALFFANDTHNLFVNSYLGGTPTWTQVV